MNPLVSVIIPVYNGEAFLREALDSVFAQDYAPLEVIVADDGSTDSSAAIAESFEGVTCLRLGRGGVSRARNLAVEAAGGEFLAFLDADDVWMPGKTASQVALARAHPKAGFVLCHRVHKFEGDVPSWFHGPIDGSPSPAFEPSSWLVRRRAFEEVGHFDEGSARGTWEWNTKWTRASS
jgi:glycosyltransferase involved in cell wall biosynthesis